MTSKGDITVEHTVWCCRARRMGPNEQMPFQPYLTPCHSYYQWSVYRPVLAFRQAGQMAKSQGWVLTREYGWLCPSCAAGLERSR